MLWGDKRSAGGAIRITASINRAIAGRVVEELLKSGVQDLNVYAGKAPVVEEARGLFGLFPRSVLVDEPTEILSLIVEPSQEQAALGLIIERGQLEAPGRGSVYSEDVELRHAHELVKANTLSTSIKTTANMHTDLAGLCCIAQRGQGDDIARVALDTGSGVPSVHYGNGTGVRDKMGLLRITIPAEKELITVPVSSYDSEMLMNLMIQIGKLDQPGRGFIYQSPLRKGVLNLRVTRGAQKHAASMEQVIGALDQMTGGSEWRRRSGPDSSKGKGLQFLTGLSEVTINVNEGRASGLVQEAMSRGASGATIARMRHVRSKNEEHSIPPARESATLIIPENAVDKICEGLVENGAIDDKAHGQIVVRPVARAFTYIAPKAG